MTLALLLTAVTGAWATEFTSLKVGDVLHVGDAINTGTNYKVYGLYLDAGYQPATLVRANIGTNDITESETGAYYLIKGKNDFYFGIIWGAEGLEGGYWPVTDTSDGISVTAITPDGSYTELTFAVHEGSAATAVEVDWKKTSNTGTFTMPGGNVTLEPEYYPQATVADGAVTAADDDARATTDDPLVKVDATKLTGAKKLMYFVSNSGTAPAYDAEGWTDQLPTAEGFTQQGIVYVWYYPVGTDEGVDGATATYSDGDICLQSITARIADAPTYAVEFADDTAEPTLWKAEPATGVTKGETVTVTYTGSKKVIGVKAEKKAAAPAISFNKVHWGYVENAPASFISVSQTDAKAAADAEKTKVNAPGYVCFYALEGGQYKWIDSHGRTGQGSDLESIVNGDAWAEVYECYNAGYDNCIWFTVSQ